MENIFFYLLMTYINFIRLTSSKDIKLRLTSPFRLECIGNLLCVPVHESLVLSIPLSIRNMLFYIRTTYINFIIFSETYLVKIRFKNFPLISRNVSEKFVWMQNIYIAYIIFHRKYAFVRTNDTLISLYFLHRTWLKKKNENLVCEQKLQILFTSHYGSHHELIQEIFCWNFYFFQEILRAYLEF